MNPLMDMTFFNGDVDGRAPYKRDKADKEVQDFMVSYVNSDCT